MNIVVRTRSGSFSFENAPGQRILYSALASGVHLPHECITGTCGTCKAGLKSGAVKVLWPKAPALSLIKPGEYLLCQCAPTEDCELEVGSHVADQDVRLAPVRRRGVIRNWRALCPDILAFSIDLESEMTFNAGQFVALEFPDVEGPRCYSMVNSDSPTRSLEFIIKRKPGGAVSDWIFAHDRTSQEVDCFGPVGKAVYDPAVRNDILCIAGGSGIAGMMSILRRAAAHRHFDSRQGRLFFGLRSVRDVFFLDDLHILVGANANGLRVTVALSEEAPSQELVAAYPALAFQQGMVHEVAARALISPLRNISAYLAGPPAAVTAGLRTLLLQLKINPSSIKYDKFS